MPQAAKPIVRALTWLLLIVGIALYGMAFSIQVNRNPLRMDEVDFYRCMNNVGALGRPLYYAGEIRLPVNAVQSLGSETLQGKTFQFYRFKPETGVLKETFFAVTDDASRYTYCLWHPPLYIYFGALFMRVFDLPIAQASLFRYTHLVPIALLLAGMALLLRELHRPGWLLGLGLGTLFLACNELAVSASILIDYNGALAMCLATWLTWVVLRTDSQPRFWPLAAVMLALAFWVGLGVGMALWLGMAFWVVIFRRPTLTRHALVLGAGVGLFLGSFWLAAQLGHFPFSQPFLHNFQRAALQTSLSSRLAMVFHYTGWYVREIGPLAVLTALLLAVETLLPRRRPEPLIESLARSRALLPPLLVVVALLSQAALGADAWGFPKYIAFCLPLLLAFTAGELAASITRGRRPWLAIALAALLVGSSAWQSSQALNQAGGTLYVTGEPGFLEATNAVARLSQPDEVILGSKDLAFYANRHFIEWSGALQQNLPLLQSRLAEQHVHLAVASENQLNATALPVRVWLTENAELVATVGANRIYRLPDY